VRDRIALNAGVRFDHSRAVSQDVHARDVAGRETDEIIAGVGTLYTWNVWSPRLGMTAKISASGRTMLRASYGRFNQGVLTGELAPIHPGMTPSSNFIAWTDEGGQYVREIRMLADGRTLPVFSVVTRPPIGVF
jgi:hypothetical protein